MGLPLRPLHRHGLLKAAASYHLVAVMVVVAVQARGRSGLVWSEIEAVFSTSLPLVLVVVFFKGFAAPLCVSLAKASSVRFFFLGVLLGRFKGPSVSVFSSLLYFAFFLGGAT